MQLRMALSRAAGLTHAPGLSAARCARSVLVAPWLILAAVLAAGGTAACGNTPAGGDIVASWAIEPAAPSVGVPVRTRLALIDGEGHPVGGADVRLEAHMSHPGMAPVVTAATERADGVYEAALELTMAGGWTVVASGTLADGRRLMEAFEIPQVR